MTFNRDTLLAAARDAGAQAYAPYSQFRVGAALLFADGAVVTAANVENASYGLSLCAETAAVARALGDGRPAGWWRWQCAGLMGLRSARAAGADRCWPNWPGWMARIRWCWAKGVRVCANGACLTCCQMPLAPR